jgi:hypothetical protein
MILTLSIQTDLRAATPVAPLDGGEGRLFSNGKFGVGKRAGGPSSSAAGWVDVLLEGVIYRDGINANLTLCRSRLAILQLGLLT